MFLKGHEDLQELIAHQANVDFRVPLYVSQVSTLFGVLSKFKFFPTLEGLARAIRCLPCFAILHITLQCGSHSARAVIRFKRHLNLLCLLWSEHSAVWAESKLGWWRTIWLSRDQHNAQIIGCCNQVGLSMGLVDYYTISLARFVKYGIAFSAQVKPTHECIFKFIGNAAVNAKFIEKTLMVMN